jgi:DTW domain-containing protein YfiP
VLQHPREREMPIGTARMATLCLPNAELHEGVHWDTDALDRVLADGSRTPILLYPGPGAIDVMRAPPRGPVTLVVVDGTWSQAKKIVRENPRLQALPRYAFVPPTPSEYRIRREPEDTYVSTIEALVHVLGALEGDPTRFDALLRPFRAMIDAQIACERTLHGAGARHLKKASWPRRPRVHPSLRAPGAEIVCVAGEANAWPYCARESGVVYQDELVHWVGCRLSTGEVFDHVIAPELPLAPRTASYVELDEERIRGGDTRESVNAAWCGFVRDTDTLCFWGHYAAGLFASQGGDLPSNRLDLRGVSRDYAKARVGTLDEHVDRLVLAVHPPRTPGRAGRRLAQVIAVVDHFLRLAAAERSA